MSGGHAVQPGITIGGALARLLAFQCPAGSGFLVEIAVTIHDGTTFVFASRDPTGTKATDRGAFREFLTGLGPSSKGLTNADHATPGTAYRDQWRKGVYAGHRPGR